MRGLIQIAFLAIVVLLVVRIVVSLIQSGKRKDPAPSRLATEVRCEKHGVRVRLETKTQEALDRARFHVQCPLCAIDSAKDIGTGN